METLFRFILARPAIQQNDAMPSIDVQHGSQLFKDLEQASRQRDACTAMKRIASQFVGTAGYLSRPADLAVTTELKKLDDMFGALEKKADVTKQDIVDAIERAFSGPTSSVNANGKLADAIGILKDTIVVIKLLPEEHSKPLEEFVRQLRDLDIVVRTVANEDLAGTGRRSSRSAKPNSRPPRSGNSSRRTGSRCPRRRTPPFARTCRSKPA